jgi:23S rRNA (cytidine1920-2'-O)/16S rRNA (cytidine1409-2'-O)-methyltransferase
VGKGNTDKGIVKDDRLIDDVIDKYKKLLANYGYRRVEIFDSSIRGGDGNRELFIYANN